MLARLAKILAIPSELGVLETIIEEIIRQSKVEFNYEETNGRGRGNLPYLSTSPKLEGEELVWGVVRIGKRLRVSCCQSARQPTTSSPDSPPSIFRESASLAQFVI